MYKKARFHKLVRIARQTDIVHKIMNEIGVGSTIVTDNGNIYIAERTKLILYVICDTGEIIEQDIYYKVKTYLAIRITDKLCKHLDSKMKEYAFLVNDSQIVNVDEFLLQYIRQY